MSKDFYHNLPVFKDFNDFHDISHYREADEDWVVIITDVKGSTKAIAEGRYRDVNRIGAMAIVAAKGVMNEMQFPFVFGGDGATFLIHQDQAQSVMDALAEIITLARENYNLELRVGHISVSEVKERGGQILVSRHQLNESLTIAMFAGGGLNIAEKLIKGEPSYLIAAKPPVKVDLNQLSCRWNPIPAKNGKIVSLIIAAEGKQQQETLKQVSRFLAGLLTHAANPVKSETMTYKGILECLRDERKYHKSILSIAAIRRAIEIVLANLIFRFGLHPIVFQPKEYVKSFETHSDYRKFDDVCRMVVDCTEAEVTSIKTYLEDLKNQGLIRYGIHICDSAIMTCVFESADAGNHIHFIDGGDGGYAEAAKMLKAQSAKTST